MRDFFIALACGIIFSVVFSSGQIENPDTHLRLTQTRILLDKGIWGFDSSTGEELHGNIAINNEGDRYMVYNPGHTLFFIPIYLVSNLMTSNAVESYYLAAFFVSFINYILHFLCVLVLYKIGLALGYKTNKALFMALLFGLTSYSFSFAQSTYEHHFEALFILLSFYYALKDDSTVSGVLTGLFLFCGLVFRSTALLALPSLLILQRKKTNRLCLILFSFLGVFLLMLYNYFRFGSPFETGYSLAWSLAFGSIEKHFSIERLPSSLWGLLFSYGKGLFIFSPTILIGVYGLPKLWMRNKRFFIAVFLFVMVYLLIISMNFAWHGSIWSFGPRYILVIIPFLYLSASEVKFNNNLIPAVIFIGFISQVLLTSVNYKRAVLEKYTKDKGINEIEYLYDSSNSPYNSQLHQFYLILPKNFSNNLRSFQPNSPWKKEYRTGSNEDVLEKSIEKNSVNYWWVRALHWQISFACKVLMFCGSLFLLFGSLFLIRYARSKDME